MQILSGFQKRLRQCASLASLAAVLVTGLAQAESALQPHVAEYKVSLAVIGSGVLRTELRPSADGYVASHTVQPTGIAKVFYGGTITDTAEFEVAANRVRPVRFLTKDEVTRDKTEADVAFDWSAGEVRGEVNGGDYVSALDQPMFDRISIQYELMNDLLNDRSRDDYVLFEFDELKDVEVRRIGKREIKVPAGRFTAVGIQHQAVGSKRITTLWCVEELGYLPVIIEQHRRGKLKMRASLRKYEPLDT